MEMDHCQVISAIPSWGNQYFSHWRRLLGRPGPLCGWHQGGAEMWEWPESHATLQIVNKKTNKKHTITSIRIHFLQSLVFKWMETSHGTAAVFLSANEKYLSM